MIKTKKYVLKSMLLALLFILIDCSSVPVTGRKQLSLVSNSELIPMSFQNYEKVLSDGKISNDAANTAKVKKVGVAIQKAVEKYMADNGMSSQLNDFAWDFNLLEENVVNAWCMPGGKVAFYTGILPVCKDELGIAVVMGHEVAHAIANHGRERMSQQMAINGILSIGSSAISNDILMQAAGAGSKLGMLKFSRSHESEADKMGLIFMSMAGYDPNEAPKFWQRMKESSSGGAPPEFMSTHPSHATRISDLQSWIPEAMTYFKK